MQLMNKAELFSLCGDTAHSMTVLRQQENTTWNVIFFTFINLSMTVCVCVNTQSEAVCPAKCPLYFPEKLLIPCCLRLLSVIEQPNYEWVEIGLWSLSICLPHGPLQKWRKGSKFTNHPDSAEWLVKISISTADDDTVMDRCDHLPSPCIFH